MEPIHSRHTFQELVDATHGECWVAWHLQDYFILLNSGVPNIYPNTGFLLILSQRSTSSFCSFAFYLQNYLI
jgi:hypothetical protein